MYNANIIQKLLHFGIKHVFFFAAAVLNISLEMEQSLVSLTYPCININFNK